MISAKTSNDLFNKVRSKFANIQLGDSMGGVTANPGDAVFFDFEFSENSDEFGRISISLADGETMKVFYNKGLVEKLEDQDKTDWYSFLKELKDFAVTHQIGFDVRDITKSNLSQQDFKNLANNNDTLNTDGMSEELSRITKLAGLSEGLTGTSRSSFENLDKTRIIIRHSKPVAEEVPGARTRHINTLYIENSEGERFKYPIVHLAGARAMARHVANGGLPHDEFGEHIIKMSEQIAQLNSFSRYVSTKDQLNDSAGEIIEKAKMKLESMRQYVKNLSKQSHYEQAKANFQPSTLAELDNETKTQLQDRFTLKHFDEKIDQVLPLINSIMSEYDDEKPLSKKDIEIPAPIDGGNEVLKFLTSGQPLVLKKDPSADMLVFRSEFKDKKDMLRNVLMDIAQRILPTSPETDTVANFASAMANDLAKLGDPFGDASSNTFKRDLNIAYKLAKHYVEDAKKMKQDPNYADVVRKDPQDVKAKVDRQGKAKVNVEDAIIEGWADNITEQKPYVSMYKGDDNKMVYDVLDKEGESAFKSDDYKVATDYLKKNFDQLAGRETDDHFDTAMTQTAMDDVNENPEANQEMSMDYEFTGDDGETAYGTLHYKVVNGKVDPNSLRGESEYEGNAKVDDEFATDMVKPGGADHEDALAAAQDDYDYEAQRMRSKFGESDEEAVTEANRVKLSPEQIKQLKLWNEKYKKYSGKNGDELPDGWIKAHTDSGITSDGYEENEIAQFEKKFGKDEFDWEDEEHTKFQINAPITRAMLDDLGKIVGDGNVSDEYTLAAIGQKILGKDFGDTYKEGNEFAQAVQKAKAAGMKPGDKFEVGGKEYTLKDAIEQAGLQLETFFGEDETVAEDYELETPEGIYVVQRSGEVSSEGGPAEVYAPPILTDQQVVAYIKRALEKKGIQAEVGQLFTDPAVDMKPTEDGITPRGTINISKKIEQDTDTLRGTSGDIDAFNGESLELDSIKKLAGI